MPEKRTQDTEEEEEEEEALSSRTLASRTSRIGTPCRVDCHNS